MVRAALAMVEGLTEPARPAEAVMNDNPLPVNFTLSEAAKAEIARLRSIWPEMAKEEPGYLSISWGEVYVNEGRQSASCW